MSEESKNSKATTAVATANATAVATEKTNWARLHGSWRDRIERMLPDAGMIDQFMYCAETQYGKNKEAFERCTPVSLLSCLMTSAKYGILPDGRNGYLIPYGNECQLQFDYKGLVHIVIRDGMAKKVYAETVCANDQFTYENGKVTKHVISFPRGPILGVYCKITLVNGEEQYELMDVDEVNVIKSCSKGSSSPMSPWNRFFGEMAKKTVFRRATKWLKLSPDVMDAIGADDSNFDFGGQKRGAYGGQASAKGAIFELPREAEPAKLSAPPVIAAEPVPTVAENIALKEKAESKNGLPFQI